MPIISAENAVRYAWGQGCDGWHLVNQPERSIIQERVPPGASEVRHYHERSWQFFLVLEGTVVLEVDGQRHQLQPRQGCEVPPMTPHQLLNESADAAMFVVISMPHSHGDRIFVGATEEGR